VVSLGTNTGGNVTGNIDKIRTALSEEEISLIGSWSAKHQKIFLALKEEIDEFATKIDKLFTVVFHQSHQGFSGTLSVLFEGLAKAWVRYTVKFDMTMKLDHDDLMKFWLDIHRMLCLFAENNIKVDVEMLRVLMLYSNHEKWQEFFAHNSDDKEDFRFSQWVIGIAICSHRQNSIEFIDLAEKTFWEIFSEEEFVNFRENPVIIRHAVLYYSDPRKFLRAVERNKNKLLAEEEFSSFGERSGVVLHAVVYHPKSSRKYLHKVMRDVDDIFLDDEFSLFRDKIWIINHAVTLRHKTPRAFLRQVKESVTDILKDDNFSFFHSRPSAVYFAVVLHHKDPRGFLLRAQAVAREILQEPEFLKFKDTLGKVSLAVIYHAKDPRSFLRGCVE